MNGAGPWGEVRSAPPRRTVSAALAIGILLVPMAFSWFTLRKGHTTLSRALSFTWATIALAATLVVAAVVAAFVAGSSAQREARANAIAALRSGATVSTTPDEIAAAYRQGAEGRSRYAGRIITVSGRIDRVRMSRIGIEMILSGQAGGRVLATLRPALNPLLPAMAQGTRTRVTCVTITHVVRMPILMGCMPTSTGGAPARARPVDPGTIV